jgi:hypothetical protein
MNATLRSGERDRIAAQTTLTAKDLSEYRRWMGPSKKNAPTRVLPIPSRPAKLGTKSIRSGTGTLLGMPVLLFPE